MEVKLQRIFTKMNYKVIPQIARVLLNETELPVLFLIVPRRNSKLGKLKGLITETNTDSNNRETILESNHNEYYR
jgi:hypothetical protein